MAKKKSIGAVLTLKDGNFQSKMRESIKGFDKFQEASRRAGKGTNSFESSLSKARTGVSDLSKELAGGALALAGVGSAAGVVEKAFSEGSSLEGYRITLDTVMKDSKKAAETMRWAAIFANKTPYETGPVVEATAKLQAYGLTAQKVLPGIGDMAAVMNKDLDQAVEAVADAQTGELERLKEFGITKAMITEHAAKTMRGVEIINNKGQITDQKAFNKALFSLMEERYKGGMEKQAKSLKGLKSTVSGVLSTGLAQMAGVSTDGTIKTGSAYDLLKQKVEGLGNAMQKLQGDGSLERWSNNLATGIGKVSSAIGFTKDIIIIASPVLAGLTGAFVAHKAMVLAATIAQRAHSVSTGISTAMLAIQCAQLEYQAVVAGGGTKVMGLITAAQWLWNYAMTANPIGAVIIGVAALAAGTIWLVKNFDKVTGAIKKAWGWLTKWRKGSKEGAGETSVKGWRQIEEQAGRNALGSAYWHGGLTWVGEHGKELVNLPKGSKISSNSQSTSTINNNSSQPIINIYAKGVTAKEVIDEVVPQIKLALANS